LEKFLDIENTPVNLEELWQSTKPIKTDEKLEEYLAHVFEWAANPDQWNNSLKDFLHEYEGTYGHKPVLNPQLQFKV
jgi:hypothetical protein